MNYARIRYEVILSTETFFGPDHKQGESQLVRSRASPNSPNKQGGPHRRLAIILAPRGVMAAGSRPWAHWEL
jgi:hypothetical protein